MACSGLRIGVVGIGAFRPLAVLAGISVVLTRLVVAEDMAPDAVERAARMLPLTTASSRSGLTPLEAPVLGDDLVAHVARGQHDPDRAMPACA